jgi:hypothetical protein
MFNDQVIVLRNKKKFEVHIHEDIDLPFEMSQETLLHNPFKDLDGALLFADRYCKGNNIAYSYRIDSSCYDMKDDKFEEFMLGR